MQPWSRWLVIVIAAVVVVYGGFIAFAEYSNGTKVNITFHLGTNGDGTMYMRCDQPPTTASEPTTTQGVCSGGESPTVTVHQRDRVHIFLVNDDKGDHSHDFNIQGWQYALPPISPEMELHQSTQEWTFTAWASGSYHVLCEIGGHDKAGMHATLVVA